jgi:hypothetical protein
MVTPEPLLIPWQGRQLRVRHDDHAAAPLTDHGKRIAAAVGLASDVDGLRVVLASTVGERYHVKVADDNSVGGLGRRCWTPPAGANVPGRRTGIPPGTTEP